ncbi:hypothetical protein [Streptomyces aureoverticillatus]|uniref:hypothetical protein n=1 Tax=Streptomyces aureoverticillatus TaxID=66871 RepID=UPI0013DAF811|nr:hypothetical protein [Streptomyces aureoverticillatus]QIB43011.1 hypothetical protein G3H79_07950 [Streptomyces aureoverticillatus]
MPVPRTESHDSLDIVPPIHEPGGFPVDSSVPDRQQCWDMLGAGVRDRLLAKAGTVVEWWARLDHDRRPRATVFGSHGLCQATSVIRNGKRVYLVERLQLEPGAMTRQSFGGASAKSRPSFADRVLRRTPPESRPRPPLPGAQPRLPGAQPPRPSTHPLDLDDDTLGILGNFPADVQEFLQRPFLRDDRRVVADWYYYETVEFAHQRVFVVFCLSADRHVTVASATRILPRGRSLQRAQWEIECCHAPVRRT